MNKVFSLVMALFLYALILIGTAYSAEKTDQGKIRDTFIWAVKNGQLETAESCCTENIIHIYKRDLMTVTLKGIEQNIRSDNVCFRLIKSLNTVVTVKERKNNYHETWKYQTTSHWVIKKDRFSLRVEWEEMSDLREDAKTGSRVCGTTLQFFIKETKKGTWKIYKISEIFRSLMGNSTYSFGEWGGDDSLIFCEK